MMKLLFVFSFFSVCSFTKWEPDFETAIKNAKQKHQLILLNFSGSDWCIPCIKMRKEIFHTTQFSDFADTGLVLYNADFPRNKRTQLDKKTQKQNEDLADKYNPTGKFPFTVLLNAEGKIYKEWDGFPDGGVDMFLKDIKINCDAHNR